MLKALLKFAHPRCRQLDDAAIVHCITVNLLHGRYWPDSESLRLSI